MNIFTTRTVGIGGGLVAVCLGVAVALGGPNDGTVISATKIVDHGPDGVGGTVRYTYVLMSEGYRNFEMNQFHADAQHFVDMLFQTPPFNTNCSLFNVWRIDVTSTDPGADDPVACTDLTIGSGAMAATYFDATFCGFGLRRRIIANSATAMNVLNQHVPGWDSALIIVNTNQYGGSGGQVAVSSNSGDGTVDWAQTAIHEFGHSAFALADEYGTLYGCYPGSPPDPSDYWDYTGGPEPMAANATTKTNPAEVKWHDLFYPGIMIPTTVNSDCPQCGPPNPFPGETRVGLYVGADFFHCGIYRPAFNCKMRVLSSPFCPVCIRRIVTVLAPNQPPPYTPGSEAEPNNGPVTATPLVVRSGYADALGAIQPAADVDYYSFSAPPRSQVWIHVDTGGPLLGAATGRDSTVQLLAGDGTTLLETDQDDGYGSGWDSAGETELSSAIAGRTLLVGGTYFVKVSAAAPGQMIGRYWLSIVVTACSPESAASPNHALGSADPIVTRTIPVGVRLAALSAAAQEDYYAVALADSSWIQVSVDADPERDGTSTDVVVELLDQIGTPVLNPAPWSAGSGGPGNPRAVSFALSLPPCSPQTYYVRVKHAAAGTGTYGLMVRRNPVEVEPNSWQSPAPLDPLYALPNGSSFALTSGSISAGDLDSFALRTPAPGGGRVWLLVDTGEASSGASRDSLLTITHDELDLTPLEVDDDDGIGNAGDNTIETEMASAIAGLSVSSAYHRLVGIQCYFSNQAIDAYSLYAVITTATPTPEVEGNGTPALADAILDAATLIGLRSGTIGPGGDVDCYSVVAAEGDLLFLSLDCNPAHDGIGTDLMLEWIAPNGITKLLTANSSFAGFLGNPPAESFCYKAQVSGRYFVQVRHVANGSGPYVLMVARNNTTSRILDEQVMGPNVQLTLTTMPKRKYRVQYTDSLEAQPLWTTLPGTVTGTGLAVGYVHANGAANPMRYYRVLQVP